MSSKEISVIALDEFVRRFVFAVVQNIRTKNFSYEERHVVDADLVPRVSKRVVAKSFVSRGDGLRVTGGGIGVPMLSSIAGPPRVKLGVRGEGFGARELSKEIIGKRGIEAPRVVEKEGVVAPKNVGVPMVSSVAEPPKVEAPRVVEGESVVASKNVGVGMMKSITEAPKVEVPRVSLVAESPKVVAPVVEKGVVGRGSLAVGRNVVEVPKVPLVRRVVPPREVVSRVVPSYHSRKVVPIAQREIVDDDGYGRIEPLLYDVSVSSIECQGAGKPVMVVRIGRRQMTKIVLSKEEIDGILEHVSEVVHIPILEGVFRAAADGFSISAVISEVVGTRFVIKKATPYSLLTQR